MSKRIFLIAFLVIGVIVQGAQLWADDDGIMDVDDNAASFSGSWINSTVRILYYGDDYEAAHGSGGSGTTATATFNTARYTDVSGYYQVYVRWTAGGQRATNATYRIYDDTGTYKGACVQNQTINGGAWMYCNEVYLDSGRRGRVILGNDNVPYNRYVCADAVRFVRQSWDSFNLVNEAGGDFAASSDNEVSVTTPQVVKSVAITAPSSGKVIVNASGYFRFASASTADGGRCSITTGSAIDYTHLVIANEIGVNTLTWNPFAATRGYNVSTGTTTFNLVCDRFSGSISIGDPTMTAIFVPTTY